MINYISADKMHILVNAHIPNNINIYTFVKLFVYKCINILYSMCYLDLLIVIEYE